MEPGAGMARKKRRTRTIASTRITDEELIGRLQDKHPHILDATVSEADFESVIDKVLTQLPELEEKPHFYCRKCGEYHLKSHPHYSRAVEK
jgi:hypothetical protein